MICLRLLIVCIIVSFGLVNAELESVVVLYRHGDRSPIKSWPKDIYYSAESLWPDGYGQLDNMGKIRQYKLGQWLRNRYDGFLPRRYNRSDIYVRSTDVDRTLMSAASNLAGLYPPVGDQVWNQNIPWQPIPVHTVELITDLLLSADYQCPKHDHLVDQLLASPEFKQLDQKNAEFYKYIANATGYPEVTLSSFSTIHSVITIYRGKNFQMKPEFQWAETNWPEIEALAAKKFQINTYTPELALLRTGPFFDYLSDYLDTMRNQSLSPVLPENAKAKFLMLSGHDTTLADRLNALGVFQDAVPEFASTIIWELNTKNGCDSSFYVNMFFRNSSGLTELTLPGCDFDCDLNRFLDILKPLSLSEEETLEHCYEN